MTTYNTRTLALEVLGDEGKGSTRTLRKFLRDELGEGKAVVGKGGRYSLDYNKRELTALKKRFTAWVAQQEADKAARDEARNSAKTPIEPETPETDNEDEGDESLDTVEGPTDEEIAAMLSDDDES